MKRKAISLIVILSIVFCSLCGLSLQANAHPATAVLNISPFTQLQEKSLWCWAACSVTVLNYYGNNVTQTQFVNFVKNATNAPNVTANVSEIVYGLNNWGKTGTIVNSYVSYGTVISNITNNRPLFVARAFNSGGGHTLLIVGYDETGANTGNVIYYDPGFNTITSVAYSIFKSGSSYTWAQTIKSVRNL